jgi:hypothetical protein
MRTAQRRPRRGHLVITKISIDGFPKEIIMNSDRLPGDWKSIRTDLRGYADRLHQLQMNSHLEAITELPPPEPIPVPATCPSLDIPFPDPKLLSSSDSRDSSDFTGYGDCDSTRGVVNW